MEDPDKKRYLEEIGIKNVNLLDHDFDTSFEQCESELSEVRCKDKNKHEGMHAATFKVRDGHLERKMW